MFCISQDVSEQYTHYCTRRISSAEVPFCWAQFLPTELFDWSQLGEGRKPPQGPDHGMLLEEVVRLELQEWDKFLGRDSKIIIHKRPGFVTTVGPHDTKQCHERWWPTDGPHLTQYIRRKEMGEEQSEIGKITHSSQA